MLILVGVVVIVLSVLKVTMFYDPPSGYNMGVGDSLLLPGVCAAIGAPLVVFGLL